MTKIFSSLPRKTAQPFAVGMRPLMETSTISAVMAPRGAEPGKVQVPGRLKAVERDAPGLRLPQDGGLIEHDDLARLECRRFQARGVHGFEGALAEDRHIEAKVLPGLHGFDEQGFVG